MYYWSLLEPQFYLASCSWLYRVVLLDSVRPDLRKSLSLKNWLFWRKSGLFCLQIFANTYTFAQHWVLLSTVCQNSFKSIELIARKNSHKLFLFFLDWIEQYNSVQSCCCLYNDFKSTQWEKCGNSKSYMIISTMMIHMMVTVFDAFEHYFFKYVSNKGSN